MEVEGVLPVLKIKCIEDSFTNKDGVEIFTRQWKTVDKQLKALIFISHGFGEHSGRYSDFLAPALVDEGFLVFSHDHVGHGRSGGERVQIGTFDTYVRDVCQHIDQMRAKFSSLPVFLFGHSMGGAIAILTAMERPKLFTGVVLSGPAIMADPETDTKCFRCLGTLLAYIAPSIQVIAALDPAATCRDKDKVEAYRNDPLVWHEGLKAGWGMAIAKAMDKIQAGMKDIDWPFIVLHGDADTLVMVDGSIQLEKLAKSKDKTIKVRSIKWICVCGFNEKTFQSVYWMLEDKNSNKLVKIPHRIIVVGKLSADKSFLPSTDNLQSPYGQLFYGVDCSIAQTNDESVCTSQANKGLLFQNGDHTVNFAELA